MKALLVILLLGNISMAIGGSGAGNGGGVHYCPQKKIAYEFYDVYEAQHRYHFNIVRSKNKKEKIIAEAIEKVRRQNISLANEIEEQIKHLKQPGNFNIVRNFHLHLIKDANLLWNEEGCSYLQLANWDDLSNKVFVEQKYYEKLSEFDRAALYLHEAIYKVARNRTEIEYSDEVRELVGEIISVSPHLLKLGFISKANDILKGTGKDRLALIHQKTNERNVLIHTSTLDLASHQNEPLGMLRISLGFENISKKLDMYNAKLVENGVLDDAVLKRIMELSNLLMYMSLEVRINDEVFQIDYFSTNLSIPIKSSDTIVLSAYAPENPKDKRSKAIMELDMQFDLFDKSSKATFRDAFELKVYENGEETNMSYKFNITQGK